MKTTRKQLNRALLNATLENDVQAMRTSLAQGADSNARDREHGETPLMLARSEEAIDVLLQHGAKVDARDERGRTPFLSTLSPLLLSRGSDINAQDNEGETALMRAVTTADLERVIWLLDNGANPNLHDSDGKTAYSIAVSYGLLAIAERLRVAHKNEEPTG